MSKYYPDIQLEGLRKAMKHVRSSGKLISAANDDPVLSKLLSQFIQQQFTKHGDVVLPTYCNLTI
jgi:hypothetical protein